MRLNSFIRLLVLSCAAMAFSACSRVPNPADDTAPLSVSSTGDGNFQVGPDYPPSPDVADRGAPVGRTFEFTMPSEQSRIFTGLDATLLEKNRHPFARKIFVYVPAAYTDGTPAPILVMQDGPSRLDLVKRALDNLTTAPDPDHRLPAFVAISVANGGGDAKGSERGLEYDTMSDRYARFIETEVLPAVLADSAIRATYPRLSFTSDPEGRATMGCSSGGAAALSMGWFRPDLYHRIITYSGTFVDQQNDVAVEEATYPLGAWEYHSGQSLIRTSPRKPLRIFLHVGETDLRSADPESTNHNWIMANERTAAALATRGYHYRFLFAKQSGHCDAKVAANTLPETLLWMWRGYPHP